MKWIIRIFLTLFLLIGCFILYFKFDNINYISTTSTQYISVNNSKQIIKTSWCDIKTPTNWIHISEYPTCPGFIGSFWTYKGNEISYEYGYFTATAPLKDPQYQVRKDTLSSGLIIYIAKRKEETGIYIPKQKEMVDPFTIYPSKSCTILIDDILESLAEIKFKNPYKK